MMTVGRSGFPRTRASFGPLLKLMISALDNEGGGETFAILPARAGAPAYDQSIVRNDRGKCFTAHRMAMACAVDQWELEGRFRLLMIRSLNGDSQAYRQLLGELSGYLRGYFARRIDGRDVEGLVQETLLVLHLKRDSYDRKLPVTSWVHAIARYKLAGYLRGSRTVRVPIEGTGDLLAVERPEEGVGRADPTLLLKRLSTRRGARSVRAVFERSVEWLSRALGIERRRPRM